MGKANKEIKQLFRDWMIFVSGADLVLILTGIMAFIGMSDRPFWFQCGMLACGVVPGAFGTRYTIRAYRGKI